MSQLSTLYKLYGQDQDNECCCMFEIQYFREQLWRGCRNLILLQQNQFKFSLWNRSLLRLLQLLSDLVLHHHLTVLTQLFLVPLDAVLVIGELVNSIIIFLQSVPSNFRCQTQISSDWSVNQTKEYYTLQISHVSWYGHLRSCREGRGMVTTWSLKSTLNLTMVDGDK